MLNTRTDPHRNGPVTNTVYPIQQVGYRFSDAANHVEGSERVSSQAQPSISGGVIP